MARSSTVTIEQRAIVLEALEDGASLRVAANAAKLGSEAAIRRLTLLDAHFATQYTHARDMALDKMADEVIAIADDETIDPASRRVRMDARRWYLSKLAPKRYGDRIEHQLTIKHDVAALSTADLEQIAAGGRTLQLDNDTGEVSDH